MRRKSRAGSKPGDIFPSKSKANCSPLPAPSMYAHTALMKRGAGFVTVARRAVLCVTAPALGGEIEGQVADGGDVAVGSYATHHLAVIVGREGRLDVALETEAASGIGLLHDVNLT